MYTCGGGRGGGEYCHCGRVIEAQARNVIVRVNDHDVYPRCLPPGERASAENWSLPRTSFAARYVYEPFKPYVYTVLMTTASFGNVQHTQCPRKIAANHVRTPRRCTLPKLHVTFRSTSLINVTSVQPGLQLRLRDATPPPPRPIALVELRDRSGDANKKSFAF